MAKKTAVSPRALAAADLRDIKSIRALVEPAHKKIVAEKSALERQKSKLYKETNQLNRIGNKIQQKIYTCYQKQVKLETILRGLDEARQHVAALDGAAISRAKKTAERRKKQREKLRKKRASAKTAIKSGAITHQDAGVSAS